jgi:subtilase-type serine protease
MGNLSVSRRSSLLAAASIIGLTIAAPAAAEIGTAPVADYDIVANHEVTPGTGSAATGANYANSPEVLDTGVTGIGQMIVIDQVSPSSAFLGLCTGTLINPRTVITAAHCVFDKPAHMYGAHTGSGGGLYGQVAASLSSTKGVPISFGFSSTNRCINTNGCASGTGPYETWRDSGFRSNIALNIYNGNQVWYYPASTTEFALGDIALVTLDTHAQDIPTWALLFSPLDGPTHASIVGYGRAGVGLSGIGDAAGIDYRRRAAENMIDALMSAHDWATTPALFGPDFTGLIGEQHSTYWFDFDDPDWSVGRAISDPNFFNNTAPEGQPDNGYYDFNAFGDGALPREGGTAGGDSGGPLIVDERWGIDVLAGVLTGGWSFGGSSYYGDMSVYPPLFLYWQNIVQNNPYKYVSAKAGNGDWFDPTHWIQEMDPNYMVIGAGGQLVNSLPGVILNPDSPVARFGEVCFLNQDCGTVTGPAYAGAPYTTIAGGPGSTNFVPNNIEPVNSPNPKLYKQARYYDVTLSRAGTTTLNKAATIDVLTISNQDAKLDIGAKGSLNVLADFTQAAGWTNIDGKLTTGEALVVSGLLTGKGTFDPTYLTVVGGIVAPGGSGAGTLTIQGDMILASASTMLMDHGDRLNVIADGSNSGILDVSGTSLVVTPGTAGRHGDSFEFATASGGIIGSLAGANALQGVLVPTVTQSGNSLMLSLQAGSLADYMRGADASALAFATALDTLRSGHYGSLWDLYGSIDWMNESQLAATFNAMTPRVIGDVGELHERQSKLLLTSVSDRLSLLASGQAEGLAMAGNVAAAMQAQADGVQSGQLGFGASHGGGATMAKLPGRMTGFIAGGIDRTASSYGGKSAYASQGGWHMAMGLEMPLGADGKFGTAAGIAEGESSPNGDSNRSRTTMAAAYAAMPLGDGFYVGGVVAAESSRASMERMSTDGNAMLRLSGATNATRYTAVAEAGFETGIGNGLTLTPRAQLGYSHYSLGGFTETGGETALKLDDVQVSRVEARLGAKLAGRTRFAGVAVVPQMSLDYVSLLSGAKTGATVRFAVAPDEAFHLPLASGSSGWAEFKGGVTFGDGPFTLGLSGQHAAGQAMTDNRAQADIRFRF